MPDEGAAVPVGLNRILADCFILRTRLEIASWSLASDIGDGVGQLLGDLVDFLDQTARVTAVRIRVLGGRPACGLEELVQLASCRPPLSGQVMDVGELAFAAMQVVRDFHTMGRLARDEGDEGTAHLLFERVARIEEVVWRLGSIADLPPQGPPSQWGPS